MSFNISLLECETQIIHCKMLRTTTNITTRVEIYVIDARPVEFNKGSVLYKQWYCFRMQNDAWFCTDHFQCNIIIPSHAWIKWIYCKCTCSHTFDSHRIAISIIRKIWGTNNTRSIASTRITIVYTIHNQNIFPI